MTKKKVLTIQPLHPDGMAVLESRPDVAVKVIDSFDEAAIIAEIGDAHGITVRLASITQRVIDAAPDLEVVARHGVGYDAVDQDALNARGIPLTITPYANAVSVAEHTFGFILSLAKRLQPLDPKTRAGDWAARAAHIGMDIEAKNLLIVGFGRIGSRVAKRALGFDMKVQVYDPYISPDLIRQAGCSAVPDMQAALAAMDIVTLHCPRNDETMNMFGGDQFTAMKSSSLIINCARGGIIDEAALTTALSGGEIAYAGLDVVVVEPMQADNPLFQLDNLIVTPHTAANSAESLRRMSIDSAQCVLDAFDGKLDPDVVVNSHVLKP